MENLKLVLRSLRAQKNLTQDYIAFKLGISQSQYNKIENGDVPVTMNRLIQIASVFNIEKKEFFQKIVEYDAAKIDISIPQKVGRPERAEQQYEPGIPDIEDEMDLNYYKNLAAHFERRFLTVYKKYVALKNNTTTINRYAFIGET